MPTQEFGQRVDDDIGAVFDRAQQDRCRHRIVDHQRHAVPCRDLRQRRNIADVAGRIADALAEYRTRVVVDQLFDRGCGIVFGEADGDALPRQDVREERVGGAVELRDRDDVAAHFSEILHRVTQRRLAGCDAQRLEAAFQRGDAALEHRGGRIADPAVAEPLGFKIEQSGAVIGTVELIGDSLIDRHRDGLGRRVRRITAVDGHRIAFHLSRARLLPRRDSIAVALSIRGADIEHFAGRVFESITLIFCKPRAPRLSRAEAAALCARLISLRDHSAWF